MDRLGPIAFVDPADPPLGDPACTERGVEVALAFLGDPHVGHEQGHRGAVDLPPLEDLDRRDPHPLLVDVGREARVAPRHHAADVHPVGPNRGEDEDVPVLVEDGVDQGHDVQVGAAPVRVVQQHDVARVEVVGEVLEHAAHPPRQGEHVPRMVPGLRDHLSARPEERAREVVEFVDHGRERGADDGRPHLAHDRDETLADHLEGDRVQLQEGRPGPPRRWRRRRPRTRTRTRARVRGCECAGSRTRGSGSRSVGRRRRPCGRAGKGLGSAHASPVSINRSPESSTRKRHRGTTTVVAPSSSTISGPV